MFLDARRVRRLDDQDDVEDDRDIRPPPLQRPRLTEQAEARRNSGEPEREVSPPLEAAAPPAQPTLGLQPFLDAELSPLERALLRNQRGNDSTSRGAGVLSRLRTTEGSGANTTTTSRQRSRTPSRPATTEAATAPLEPAPNFDAFVANRTKAFKNKKSRESLGKELRFDKATPRQQQLLLKAREAEWQNWTSYKSVDIISQEEASRLIATGVKPVPTRWVELDKNEALRVPGGPTLPPKMKSRLVVRGDLEEQAARTDSPTSSMTAHNLVLSFAASRSCPLGSADIT
jgi:hypothetical protein